MGFTRTQRHHRAACDRFSASKQKPLTRKQVRAWLLPVRQAITTMRSGEIESIRGYPVTRLHFKDAWERIDWCCAGFRCLINRVLPSINTAPLLRVENKLANGVPLTVGELDAVLALLNLCEDALLTFKVEELQDAVLSEQIKFEIENLGLKEAA